MSLEIAPNTEKKIIESKVENDLTTKIGSIEILYQQIEAHKKAIRDRSNVISEANDTKNESDLAIIRELETQIKELQN